MGASFFFFFQNPQPFVLSAGAATAARGTASGQLTQSFILGASAATAKAGTASGALTLGFIITSAAATGKAGTSSGAESLTFILVGSASAARGTASGQLAQTFVIGVSAATAKAGTASGALLMGITNIDSGVAIATPGSAVGVLSLGFILANGVATAVSASAHGDLFSINPGDIVIVSGNVVASAGVASGELTQTPPTVSPFPGYILFDGTVEPLGPTVSPSQPHAPSAPAASSAEPSLPTTPAEAIEELLAGLPASREITLPSPRPSAQPPNAVAPTLPIPGVEGETVSARGREALQSSTTQAPLQNIATQEASQSLPAGMVEDEAELMALALLLAHEYYFTFADY